MEFQARGYVMRPWSPSAPVGNGYVTVRPLALGATQVQRLAYRLLAPEAWRAAVEYESASRKGIRTARNGVGTRMSRGLTVRVPLGRQLSALRGVASPGYQTRSHKLRRRLGR
jgi:hypothetical protein